MTTRARLAIAAASILALTAAGLFLGRPPWPGAGDEGKLRVPAVRSTGELPGGNGGEGP